MSGVRVLGLDIEGLQDFRTATKRNSGLYRAVDERLPIVHTFTPQLPTWRLRLIQLLHVAPGRDRWRRRAGLSPMSFRARTNLVERELREHEGTFDVVLQIYCVFAPGRLDAGRPYAMYLDATAALTRRDFPEGMPVSQRAYKRWLAFEHDIYRKARRLFPASDWVRRSLIDDYGVDPSKIDVVGAGSNFVVDELADRRWDQQVALFVGLDWERKGGPVLLKAWRQVRDALPEAELWIVGTRRAYGPEGQDGVRWFGRIPPDQVAELYVQSSVFVLPSLFDPFPHVLREAMAHGLPCITTATGGTAEILNDGEEGVFVPVGKTDALARETIRLLGDPRCAESMGRAGHTRMREADTWQRVADRIVPHLEEMAGR